MGECLLWIVRASSTQLGKIRRRRRALPSSSWFFTETAASLRRRNAGPETRRSFSSSLSSSSFLEDCRSVLPALLLLIVFLPRGSRGSTGSMGRLSKIFSVGSHRTSVSHAQTRASSPSPPRPSLLRPPSSSSSSVFFGAFPLSSTSSSSRLSSPHQRRQVASSAPLYFSNQNQSSRSASRSPPPDRRNTFSTNRQRSGDRIWTKTTHAKSALSSFPSSKQGKKASSFSASSSSSLSAFPSLSRRGGQKRQNLLSSPSTSSSSKRTGSPFPVGCAAAGVLQSSFSSSPYPSRASSIPLTYERQRRGEEERTGRSRGRSLFPAQDGRTRKKSFRTKFSRSAEGGHVGGRNDCRRVLDTDEKARGSVWRRPERRSSFPSPLRRKGASRGILADIEEEEEEEGEEEGRQEDRRGGTARFSIEEEGERKGRGRLGSTRSVFSSYHRSSSCAPASFTSRQVEKNPRRNQGGRENRNVSTDCIPATDRAEEDGEGEGRGRLPQFHSHRSSFFFYHRTTTFIPFSFSSSSFSASSSLQRDKRTTGWKTGPCADYGSDSLKYQAAAAAAAGQGGGVFPSPLHVDSPSRNLGAFSSAPSSSSSLSWSFSSSPELPGDDVTGSRERKAGEARGQEREKRKEGALVFVWRRGSSVFRRRDVGRGVTTIEKENLTVNRRRQRGGEGEEDQEEEEEGEEGHEVVYIHSKEEAQHRVYVNGDSGSTGRSSGVFFHEQRQRVRGRVAINKLSVCFALLFSLFFLSVPFTL